MHQTEGSIELHAGIARTGGKLAINHTANLPPENPLRIPSLIVMQTENAASLSAGYTPILNFDVEDMDTCIANAMNMGASLDGPIRYPTYGKVAAIRSPDGHMIGLFQPAES